MELKLFLKKYSFLLLFFGFVSVKSEVLTPNAEKRLLDNLLKNYDPHVRPVKNSSNPVLLTIQMFLIIVEDLSERDQILKSVCWIKMNWNDEYLTWNPDDYDGVDIATIKPNAVWLPDLALMNSARTVHGAVFGDRFMPIVRYNGDVEWITSGNIDTLCFTDLSLFPFDEHTCNFIISNWAYTADQQLLKNGTGKLDLRYYTENAEWSLKSTSAYHMLLWFEGTPYNRIVYEVKLQRKPGYVINNVLIPTVLLSILSLLVFTLPVDSGEKISLSITVLLSYSVFLLLIQESTPATSDYLPLLVKYLMCEMILSGASVGCSVLVLNIHYRRQNTSVPGWIRYIVFAVIGRIVFFDKWKEYAFKGKEKSSKTAPENNCNHVNVIDTEVVVETPLLDLKNAANSKESSRLEKQLKIITDKLIQNEEEEKLGDELKAAAIVLDRLFLLFFFLCTFVCSVILLQIYPFVYTADTNENKSLFVPNTGNATRL